MLYIIEYARKHDHHIISVCVCVRVCATGGHRKCIDLQPNATASLDDGEALKLEGDYSLLSIR